MKNIIKILTDILAFSSFTLILLVCLFLLLNLFDNLFI